MNERIRDIAIECANQLDWDYGDSPEEYTYTEYNVERFARMIIEDAVNALNADALERGDVTTTVGTVGKLLKKHFGISE